MMTRRYFDKGNTREVNYVRFCQDVDKPEDMFPGYMAKNPPPPLTIKDRQAPPRSTFFADSTQQINVLENRFMQPKVNIANDPHDIERRIQACVVMKRVRMTEFFRDFDKLRKGKVTPTQAQSIINQLGFHLSLEEHQSLAEKYQADDGNFNYAAFCAYIDSAFTQKGIEYAPTSTVQPVTSENTVLARRKFLEFTPEEQVEVQAIIDAFRKAVVNKRINLKPMF